jgi:hypothetical protein
VLKKGLPPLLQHRVRRGFDSKPRRLDPTVVLVYEAMESSAAQ